MFGQTKNEEHKLHQHKNTILIYEVDINKILMFNKVSFGKKGFKYFIDYKDGKKVRSLCVFLPKISACKGDFDETKYMSFLIKNNEVLEKYNEIWPAILLKKDLTLNKFTMKNI